MWTGPDAAAARPRARRSRCGVASPARPRSPGRALPGPRRRRRAPRPGRRTPPHRRRRRSRPRPHRVGRAHHVRPTGAAGRPRHRHARLRRGSAVPGRAVAGLDPGALARFLSRDRGPRRLRAPGVGPDGLGTRRAVAVLPAERAVPRGPDGQAGAAERAGGRGGAEAAAGAAGEHRGRRDPHRGDDAALLAGPQRHPDRVADGEPADHEEAHAPRGGDVDGGRRAEALVRVGEVLVGHADAAVGDLEDDRAVLLRTGHHVDPGLRGREGGGVLQQLGDEVDDVARGPAEELDRRRRGELDALVLLDLGRGGAQHVDERHRAAAAAGDVGAGEDQEVLGVAAHARREVVELEELGEGLRVLLLVLQLLDEAQLALDEGLRAAREVDEDAVERGAQPGLLGGQPHRLLVHLVERAGDLADLLARLDRGPAHLGVGCLALAQAADGGGEPALGDVEGRAAQQPQGPQQRAGHEEHHGRARHEGEQQHHRRHACRVARAVLQRGGVVLQALAQLVGDAGDLLLHGVGRRVPVLRGDLQRQARAAPAEHDLGEPVPGVDVGPDDGVGQGGVVGAHRAAELVDGDAAPQRGVAGLVDRRGVDPPAGDGRGHHGLHVRVLLADHRERVEAVRQAGDRRVGGLPGERLVEGQHRGGRVGVAGDRPRRVDPAVADVVAQPVELADGARGVAVGGARLVVHRVRRLVGAAQAGELVVRVVHPLLDRPEPAGPVRREEHRGAAPLGVEGGEQPGAVALERDGLLHAVVGPGRLGLLDDPQHAQGDDEDRRHEQDGRELDRQAPVAQCQPLAQRRVVGRPRVGAARAGVTTRVGSADGSGHALILPIAPVGRSAVGPGP